jgi:hypothetical protein
MRGGGRRIEVSRGGQQPARRGGGRRVGGGRSLASRRAEGGDSGGGRDLEKRSMLRVFLQSSRNLSCSRSILIGRPPLAVCTVAPRCPVAHDTSPYKKQGLELVIIIHSSSLYQNTIQAAIFFATYTPPWAWIGSSPAAQGNGRATTSGGFLPRPRSGAGDCPHPDSGPDDQNAAVCVGFVRGSRRCLSRASVPRAPRSTCSMKYLTE